MRSTVGLSGLPPAECGAYVAAWLRGERPPSPVADMSPALALRFAIDDLKAYALEAAIAGDQAVEQAARRLAVERDRARCGACRCCGGRFLAGDDERLKAVAAFFVPALRVPPAG